MSVFVEAREMIERIKDVISKDTDGFVYDYHVADALDISYSTLRINIMKNKPPIVKIIIFCRKNGLNIDDFLFNVYKSKQN